MGLGEEASVVKNHIGHDLCVGKGGPPVGCVWTAVLVCRALQKPDFWGVGAGVMCSSEERCRAPWGRGGTAGCAGETSPRAASQPGGPLKAAAELEIGKKGRGERRMGGYPHLCRPWGW